MTIITAHSGCEGTEIDSPESVEKALELGADAVEMDVRADRDGVLRISHNAVMQPEYLKKAELKNVLGRILHTDLSVNFDIKEEQALLPTLAEAESLGFDRERLIISGCTGPDTLIKDPSLTKRARFFINFEEIIKYLYVRREKNIGKEERSELMNDPWNFIRKKGIYRREEYFRDTISLYRDLGADALNLSKRLLGTAFLDALHNGDIPLSVWTVGEPELVRQCLDLNVFNITTRDVRQAIGIRRDHPHSA